MKIKEITLTKGFKFLCPYKGLKQRVRKSLAKAIHSFYVPIRD